MEIIPTDFQWHFPMEFPLCVISGVIFCPELPADGAVPADVVVDAVVERHVQPLISPGL